MRSETLIARFGLPCGKFARAMLPVDCRRYARHLQTLRTRSDSDLAADLNRLIRDLARAAEEDRQPKLYGRPQDSATNPWTAGENA